MDEIHKVESGIILSKKESNRMEGEDHEYEVSDTDKGSAHSFLIISQLQIPPPTKCQACFEKYTPTCPPPVCYILTEQLIAFVILCVICVCIFLMYWFIED